ncbi:MAG TPA: UDP-N-acetylglucosamine 2-epimerase (non-hydrolyzing) [Kiritimatiellia bacterium]|nr:UDP-N-acetylglucosamine 2-epimerase (non-hydrolyzing) [Kiritimatiellia bacterium]
MRSIVLLAGARPNYMKIFPLWREIALRRADHFRPVIVHTGQHYDPLMNDVFFTEFGMPKPDHFLGIGSGTHGAQTGKALIALEDLFLRERPDGLVVVGDVNSTAAGALAAVKLGIPVAHVEAGLRSGDRTMPEEINRLVTDAICDLLLTPSPDADANLLREGIPAEKIVRVGNVMIDSLVQLLPSAQTSRVLDRWGLAPKAYIAVTLHRPNNVDDPRTLLRLLDELQYLAREWPVVFPVHPRTAKLIEQTGFRAETAALQLVPPLGYIDFLRLQSDAALVVTDSGGVQEETTFLGIPCLTVRPNTERPITITEGTNRLINLDRESLVDAARAALLAPPRRPVIEGWDGNAASRIMHALERWA